ncbi:polysaccharide lyase family 7 protein [Pseudomonas indica]|uniref:polysaccharide lyase family 7 protein n=1 Tax=Pseudomonas indica TaxID=137658 RepID=UPI003FD60509
MIDLAIWNLSIPVGVPATTIETRVLATGYQDHYFKNNGYNTVFFWAPVNGTTTESASYPRTELRETYPDGRLRNWTYPSADNFLRAGLKVSQVPSTGKIVVGQIHAYKSSRPLLKLEYQYKARYDYGNIVVKVRRSPDDETSEVINVLSGVPLNQRFIYSIHLTPKGTLSVNVNATKWTTKLDSAWATKPLYFKAGVYTQDNTGYETEAGAAIFDKLQIEHRPLPM